VIKAYFNLLQAITGKNAWARGTSKQTQPSQTLRRPGQPLVGRLLANPQPLTGAFNHTLKILAREIRRGRATLLPNHGLMASLARAALHRPGFSLSCAANVP
jgi:hypothetical protein